MTPTIRRLTGPRLLVLCCLMTTPLIADAGEHKFRLELDVKMDMVVEGESESLKSTMAVDYAWEHGSAARALSLNSLKMQVRSGGEALADMRISADEFTVKRPDRTVRIKAVDAPEELKAKLLDTFNTPLLKITRDAEGAILKRVILVKPSSAVFDGEGLIDNILFFHPDAPKHKKEWKLPVKMHAADGISIGGNLTYTKQASKAGLIVCGMSGDLGLIGKGGKNGQTPVDEGTYRVNGTASYDPKLGIWRAADQRLLMNFAFTEDGSKVTTQGEMRMVLKHLAD